MNELQQLKAYTDKYALTEIDKKWVATLVAEGSHRRLCDWINTRIALTLYTEFYQGKTNGINNNIRITTSGDTD